MIKGLETQFNQLSNVLKLSKNENADLTCKMEHIANELRKLRNYRMSTSPEPSSVPFDEPWRWTDSSGMGDYNVKSGSSSTSLGQIAATKAKDRQSIIHQEPSQESQNLAETSDAEALLDVPPDPIRFCMPPRKQTLLSLYGNPMRIQGPSPGRPDSAATLGGFVKITAPGRPSEWVGLTVDHAIPCEANTNSIDELSTDEDSSSDGSGGEDDGLTYCEVENSSSAPTLNQTGKHASNLAHFEGIDDEECKDNWPGAGTLLDASSKSERMIEQYLDWALIRFGDLPGSASGPWRRLSQDLESQHLDVRMPDRSTKTPTKFRKAILRSPRLGSPQGLLRPLDAFIASKPGKPFMKVHTLTLQNGSGKSLLLPS